MHSSTNLTSTFSCPRDFSLDSRHSSSLQNKGQVISALVSQVYDRLLWWAMRNLILLYKILHAKEPKNRTNNSLRKLWITISKQMDHQLVNHFIVRMTERMRHASCLLQRWSTKLKKNRKRTPNSLVELKNSFAESLTQNGIIKTPTSEATALKWSCRSLFAH